MHYGSSDAAFRLLQRGRALKGIAKLGWSWRLRMANAARLKKREERLHEAAALAERQRLKSECRLTDEVLVALRGRYGSGGFSANYGENQCRPVIPVPGARCSRCGWEYGNPEPHVIAVP
jgi:hypothetical protein